MFRIVVGIASEAIQANTDDSRYLELAYLE